MSVMKIVTESKRGGIGTAGFTLTDAIYIAAE